MIVRRLHKPSNGARITPSTKETTVKNQAGYTLPELLLVIFMGTVGLFILLCVIALFKFLLQFIFS